MRKLEPKDITGLAAAPQALDNQWVPQALLRQRAGDRRTPPEQVLAEYRRAILNSDHVLLNRAYLWNSPTVFGDYATEGAERDAFVRLVNDGSILPFLFDEADPWVEPRFTVHPEGKAAWERMRGVDLEPRCVRLSWDDDDNETLTGDMGTRFAENCTRLYFKQADRLCSDLGLPPGDAARLESLLHKVTTMAIAARERGEAIRREDLYRELVTEGADPAQAAPTTDPLGGAIKELIDLNYNANLPDTLRVIGGVDTFLLTPAGSPSRLVLQEELRARLGTTPEELAGLASMVTLDEALHQIHGPGFAQLDLSDLARARRSDEWLEYMASARRLVASQRDRIDADALTGDDGLHALYERYNLMVERIAADRAGDERDGRVARRRDAAARWTPRIKLVISIGAWILELLPGEHFRILGMGAGTLRAGMHASDLSSVRAVIEGDRRRGEADLDMSIDLASITVRDPQGAADAVIEALRERGYTPDPDDPPGGAGREAEVVNDPNLAAE